ncbi:hypothetical protein [Catenulispora rubra]|uniref:hypothetical protein n=1 Tax=Catenulispora rubra TaxID=280293 RepID=UPI001892782A|nr:hypothetical protein [Catenulispora rubra]
MRTNRAWLGLTLLMLPTLIVAMDMTGLVAAVIFAALSVLVFVMRPVESQPDEPAAAVNEPATESAVTSAASAVPEPVAASH